MTAHRHTLLISCLLLCVQGNVTLAQRPTADASPASQEEQAEVPLDDAIEFMLDHHLWSLAADELERRALHSPTAAERSLAITQLADVYTELIAQAKSLEAQLAWEDRALRVIDEVKGVDTETVKLTLARAAFLRLREIGEQSAYGLLDPKERINAAAKLRDVAGKVGDIAQQAREDVDRLENTQRSADSDRLRQRLYQRRALAGQADFIAGWALVYAAEMEQSELSAQAALTHLGNLLNPPAGPLNTQEILEGSFTTQHLCEAMVGAARALSVADEPTKATALLLKLETTPGVAPHIIDASRLARVRALATSGQWRDVASLVDVLEQESTNGQLSIKQARLLAVLSMDGAGLTTGRRRSHVRDRSLAALIAAGELGHVTDLVNRYGTAPLGTNTFIGAYVRGLGAYRKAREAHEEQLQQQGKTSTERASTPTNDVNVADIYTQAAERFEAAIGRSDAQDYEEALAHAMTLLAECMFLSSDSIATEGGTAGRIELVLRAGEEYAQAAELLSDSASAQSALWRAIVAYRIAIDKASQAGTPSDTAQARLDELTRAFIDRYPHSNGAARLHIERAIAGDIPASRAIPLLLDVSEDAPDAPRAKRAAAKLAYEAMKQAAFSDRAWHARRFIGIAQPVMLEDYQASQDTQLAGSARQEAADSAAAHARLLLDAALATDPADTTIAEQSLDVLNALGAQGVVDTTAFADELALQRARLAISQGDAEAARRVIADTNFRDKKQLAAAQRVLFTHAITELRKGDMQRAQFEVLADGRVEIASAEAVVSTARGLLGEVATTTTTEEAEEERMLAVREGFAEALLVLARQQSHAAHAAAAHEVYNELLQEQPNETRLLRGRAYASELSGARAAALDDWRTLVNGLRAGSASWFEARYNHVRLLASFEEAKAQQIIRTHAALYAPTFGPAPWGAHLRALHESITEQRGQGGGT